MNPRTPLLLALALLLPACGKAAPDPRAAAAASAEVVSATLGNGMEVLVLQDSRAPVAVSHVWYRVGSADEIPGQTGISHFLEHMMFRGTEKHPGQALTDAVTAAGGRSNAYTSRDYTSYYEVLPAERLELAFALEADRMRNLSLREEDVRREKEVVKEERLLTTQDVPESYAYEQLYATAFQNNPYGQPVIGWMGDIERTTARSLRGWYRRWYTPSNARLVVVGDIDPQEVFRLARRHFEGVPDTPAQPYPARTEPVQAGPRRVDLNLRAQTEYVIIGFKTPNLLQLPEARAWEAYALAMLSAVLDGGTAARLESRLVRAQQVAAAADAGYSLYAARPDLLLVDGTPAQGRSAEELERALLEEIRLLRTEPVGAEELDRARAQVVADEIYARDSITHRAHMIGQLETMGLGWEVDGELVERYRAVTAEQVREVAQLYLTENASTTVVVRPLRGARAAAR